MGATQPTPREREMGRMQRLILVAAICGSIACRSGTAAVGGTLGFGFALTGNALVLTSEGDSAQRTVGFVSIAVATYMFLMTGILETRAAERAAVATAASTPDDPGGDVEHTGSDESIAGDEPATSDSPAAHPGPSASPVAGRRGGAAYDRTGAYAGRVDEQGNVYDRTGAYAGRIDPQGAYYDRTGAPAGRVDHDQYYDRTGAPAGRIDAQGQYYDRTGAPAGRIDESGNVYDRTGAYAGRVDGSCDAECRRITAGRILLEP
jgi:hypothetical protein